MTRSLWLVLLLLFALQGAAADTLSGRVVRVVDSDTLVVRDGNNAQYKIRLVGIDAPEKAQPFGQRSKQSLSALTFDRAVSIDWQKHDRYGRIVGKVLEGGQDVNLWKVEIPQ